MRKAIAMIAGSFATAGCSAEAPPLTVPLPSPCPIVNSRDWRAWVNVMPGPMNARSTLHVVGKVTLPSGEWVPRFEGVRVMESYPVQVVVELDAARTSSGVQIPVEREVRGSWQSEPAVGSVTIVCSGTTLTRISPVETAH